VKDEREPGLDFILSFVYVCDLHMSQGRLNNLRTDSNSTATDIKKRLVAFETDTRTRY